MKKKLVGKRASVRISSRHTVMGTFDPREPRMLWKEKKNWTVREAVSLHTHPRAKRLHFGGGGPSKYRGKSISLKGKGGLIDPKEVI